MVGCLHIPEFPAWTLRAQQPDSHAVAVYHRGLIIARSRFLVQAGMLLGDPLERARALFPGASFFARDTPLEQAAWDGALRQIHAVTPYLQPLACGVAFFRPVDVSEARLLAAQLAAHVGLAPNKCVARIAAARCAPESVLHIRAGTVSHFFSRTNVSVLPRLGFDKEISLRLELFGLTTLALAGTLTQKHLRVQFGSAGLALFDLLHPSSEMAHVPAYTPPVAITETFVADFRMCNTLHLSSLLGQLVRRAALRLERLCCNHILLRVQPADDKHAPRVVQRAFKNPTSEAGVINRAATFLLESALRTPFDVSALELTLGGLENQSLSQATLFFERPPLSAAIERLDERFPGAIKRASIVRPDAPFPEESVRFAPFFEPSAPSQ